MTTRNHKHERRWREINRQDKEHKTRVRKVLQELEAKGGVSYSPASRHARAASRLNRKNVTDSSK